MYTYLKQSTKLLPGLPSGVPDYLDYTYFEDMSSGSSPRSARPPVASIPATQSDHRKRRRNRTTQSCLNCHASKRMCDRKRPACQRCTTLGLTGLCVYEVDDPSQRNTSSDEKALLRNRVAELEGVIREMKNKPHPRWVHKSPVGRAQDSPSYNDDGPDKTITVDIHLDINDGNEEASVASSSCANSRLHAPSVQLTPVPASDATVASESPLTPQDPQFLGVFNLPSPPHSSTSPSPVNSHRMLPQAIINDSHTTNPSIVDGLIQSACLEHTGLEEGIYGHILDHILRSDQANALRSCGLDAAGMSKSDCGCINSPIAYNSLLELSLRLRKAAETLGKVADHQSSHLGSECELFSKICELDKLTSSMLGNTMPPGDHHTTGDSYFSPPGIGFTPSSISPNCLSNIHHWEAGIIRPSMSGTNNDDTLMSWDGVSRESWPPVPKP